jgi:hypothetical protein
MRKLFSITATQKNYPLIILVSAFLPYISPTSGIKGDNLVVYSMLFFALSTLLIRQKIMVNKYLSNVLLIWLAAFIFLLSRTILGGGYINGYSFVAEIKNFSQPLAIIFIFLMLFYKISSETIDIILKKVSLLLVFLLSINTLWTFLGMSIDLFYINKYFVRETALNAAGNSRFSGIFNQPMEAGISYSIGLSSWMYLVSKKYISVNMKYVTILILLLVGGILSVSKIFIFGGIGIFVANFIFRKQILKKSKKLLVWLPILIPFTIIYLKNWEGVTYLNRLFLLENYQRYGFLYLISAGRYGGEVSQQETYFNRVWNNSPLIGEGMGSQVIYDSAFFHFFSSGGIFALCMYILLIIYFLVTSIQSLLRKYSKDESFFYFNIVLIILFGSFGSPILTVNRASVIVWVFVSILLTRIYKKREETLL